MGKMQTRNACDAPGDIFLLHILLQPHYGAIKLTCERASGPVASLSPRPPPPTPMISPHLSRAAASIHPSIRPAAAAAAAAGLTQCFDCDLPRQRRRQVDADQIHILMQQHVVDPVGVKRYVHLLGQLLRLLLRPAPQRFDGEALVLQQRDDHPGGQAGAEHADPWKHGSGVLV